MEHGPWLLEQEGRSLRPAQHSPSSFVVRVNFLGTLCPSVPQGECVQGRLGATHRGIPLAKDQ